MMNWILGAVLLSVTLLAFADADVEFSGTLVSEPCTVTTDTQHQTVEFGTLAAQSFKNATRSEPKDFSLHLEGCDLSLGTTVKVTFTGTEDGTQTGAFATTGEAKGVAIALEDENGHPALPGKALAAVNLSQNDTLLKYKAFVQAQDRSKIQEGEFESQVVFSLEYE